MVLERSRLDVSASPQDALRHLRGDRMPFALIGDWAGSRAVLGSEPFRGRLDSLTELDLELGVGVSRRGRPGPTTTAAAADAPSDAAGEAVGGGWFGWLGYGVGAMVDRFPVQPRRPEPLERLGMAFYDHVLRLDSDGVWWFEALVTEARRAALRGRRRLLEARLRGAPSRAAWRVGDFEPAAPGYAGHMRAVEGCLGAIRAGEVFQANICLRLESRLEGSRLEAFAVASERLDPARGAYFERGRQALLSLSPELFLRRRGRTVETAPIKGTLRRSAEPGAAARERESLTGSAKATAENVMIVDLMRNDLGRVCEPGTIRAGLPPHAEAHPGVWHLVTPVEGMLREGIGDAELVRATFPPGSVTGAPKLQAIEVISRLEASAREVYTGAIGLVSPLAGLELSVAIRSFEMRGERLWLGSGGGIVADSTARGELGEALDKARPLVAALGSRLSEAGAAATPYLGGRAELDRPDPELGLLETVAVEDGEPVRLSAHLERLTGSLYELYGEPLEPGLEREVRWAAAQIEAGRGRVRVIARPSAGEIAVEYQALPAGGPAPDVALLREVVLPGGLGAHKWADRRFVASFTAGGIEPLLLDGDAAALEAGSANVWIIEGRRLLTPPADGRILPGVTRAALLGATRPGGFEAAVEGFCLERLRAADGVLLSSSVRLVRAAGLEARPTAAAIAATKSLRSFLREAGPATRPDGGALVEEGRLREARQR